MDRRQRAVAITVMVAAVGVSGVLAELGIRALAAVDESFGDRLRAHDPYAVQIRPAGKHGYRQIPNGTFPFGNGTVATSNAQGFRGPEVAVPKPTGRIRIALLGGSTTHGWGVAADETIDAHMRRLLVERYPDRTFDVINLAFDGYDAYQLLERARADAVPLEVDILVVNSGINDVRNALLSDLSDPDPRTLIWEVVVRRLRAEEDRGGPSLKSRIKHYSAMAQLLGLVRAGERRSDSVVPQDPNYEAARIFEENLRRIATLARERGMAVLFSTPPSALKLGYEPEGRTRRSYFLRTLADTQMFRDTLAGRTARVSDEFAAMGYPTRYVTHEPTADWFIDDCHLNNDGNHHLADNFVRALRGILDALP